MTNNYSKFAAIMIAALALAQMPCSADNTVEAYQMTITQKSGAKQSLVLVKPDEAVGPKYLNRTKQFLVNGKTYAAADIQSIRIEKTMVSAIKDVNLQQTSTKTDMVYSIDGKIVKRNSASLADLPKGIYIVNGKKYIKK